MKSQLIDTHYWDLWEVCLLLRIYQAPWWHYQKVGLVSVVSDSSKCFLNAYSYENQSALYCVLYVRPLYPNWLKTHQYSYSAYQSGSDPGGYWRLQYAEPPTHTHKWEVHSSVTCDNFYHRHRSWVAVKGDKANPGLIGWNMIALDNTDIK